eukprot:TRINITY_DN32442_c0_g1_i1.p1 TRINITY_DN32442_c0_g1~~TRINITY_DN32442_c0_g1_i1.p1  ORF type:complete len:224 (-),score=47.70 TRINITY_DN32442_c0_g1_i1:15-686(-)
MVVCLCLVVLCFFFFFQAEDGIRDVERSRGLGDVYKRQALLYAKKIKDDTNALVEKIMAEMNSKATPPEPEEDPEQAEIVEEMIKIMNSNEEEAPTPITPQHLKPIEEEDRDDITEMATTPNTSDPTTTHSLNNVSKILSILQVEYTNDQIHEIYDVVKQIHDKLNGELDIDCLLYTSDAADDTPCVDLGGRRIIKKKKKRQCISWTHTPHNNHSYRQRAPSH